MVKKATAAKHALCDRLLFIAFYIRKQGQCFNSAVKLQTPFKPYLSCFSSASFLPPFIIIFLPSLLLMLISRKAGYHSFVLPKTSQYIKFVQVFYYIFRGHLYLLLYLLTPFNMVSNMNNSKYICRIFKILTQIVSHNFSVHINIEYLGCRIHLFQCVNTGLIR